MYRPNRVARGANPTAANATPVSATTQRGTWSAFGGNGIHPIATAMIAEPAVQKAMANNHAMRRDEPNDPLELALTTSKIHMRTAHESIAAPTVHYARLPLECVIGANRPKSIRGAKRGVVRFPAP